MRTAPGLHASTAAWLGGEGRQVHSLHAQIDGVTATLSASDVAVLSEDPTIARMSIDAVVRATAGPTPGAVLRGALGLKTNGGVISGERKWKGRGVRVAVIDSGIEPSDDLKSKRIRYFFDFTQGGVQTDAYDDYGHGTHVAGLVAGKGKLSDDEYEGPAPEAKFIGVKVLDGTGSGYTSDVLAGLEYVINNNDTLAVDVINLSLGHPIFEPAATDPLVLAIERAVAEGIVVVASAGNMGMNPVTGLVGYAGISSPGNAPSAITVGSVDLHYTAHRADDTVGTYSSRGPTWYDAFAKPDLVAPGHQLAAAAALESSLYQDNPNLHVAWTTGNNNKPNGNNNPARYLRLTGTSMAAAVTTGVVAMMVDAADDRKAAASYDDEVLALLNAESDVETPGDPLATGDQMKLINAQNPNQTIDVAALPPPADTPEDLERIAEMKQALDAQVGAMVAAGDFPPPRPTASGANSSRRPSSPSTAATRRSRSTSTTSSTSSGRGPSPRTPSRRSCSSRRSRWTATTP